MHFSFFTKILTSTCDYGLMFYVLLPACIFGLLFIASAQSQSSDSLIIEAKNLAESSWSPENVQNLLLAREMFESVSGSKADLAQSHYYMGYIEYQLALHQMSVPDSLKVPRGQDSSAITTNDLEFSRFHISWTFPAKLTNFPCFNGSVPAPIGGFLTLFSIRSDNWTHHSH